MLGWRITWRSSFREFEGVIVADQVDHWLVWEFTDLEAYPVKKATQYFERRGIAVREYCEYYRKYYNRGDQEDRDVDGESTPIVDRERDRARERERRLRESLDEADRGSLDREDEEDDERETDEGEAREVEYDEEDERQASIDEEDQEFARQISRHEEVIAALGRIVVVPVRLPSAGQSTARRFTHSVSHTVTVSQAQYANSSDQVLEKARQVALQVEQEAMTKTIKEREKRKKAKGGTANTTASTTTPASTTTVSVSRKGSKSSLAVERAEEKAIDDSEDDDDEVEDEEGESVDGDDDSKLGGKKDKGKGKDRRRGRGEGKDSKGDNSSDDDEGDDDDGDYKEDFEEVQEDDDIQVSQDDGDAQEVDDDEEKDEESEDDDEEGSEDDEDDEDDDDDSDDDDESSSSEDEDYEDVKVDIKVIISLSTIDSDKENEKEKVTRGFPRTKLNDEGLQSIVNALQRDYIQAPPPSARGNMTEREILSATPIGLKLRHIDEDGDMVDIVSLSDLIYAFRTCKRTQKAKRDRDVKLRLSCELLYMKERETSRKESKATIHDDLLTMATPRMMVTPMPAQTPRSGAQTPRALVVAEAKGESVSRRGSRTGLTLDVGDAKSVIGERDRDRRVDFKDTYPSNTGNNAGNDGLYPPPLTGGRTIHTARSLLNGLDDSSATLLNASLDGSSTGVYNIVWKKGDMVGSGSFGKVFAGINLSSGDRMAIKEVEILKTRHSRDQVKALQREVKILSSLEHRNIIRYLGTEYSEDMLRIFLELATDGSLKDALQEFGAFPEPLVQRYGYDIILGLGYLHSKKLIHRDIKPANLLLSRGVVKLADFGCSSSFLNGNNGTESAHSTVAGTTIYMAPEVMQAGEDGAELMNAVGDMNSHYSSDGEGNGNDSKRKYGRKADIWSLGMTLCELANGSPPFKTAAAAIFAVCVSKKWPSFPEIFSDVAHSFLARCLVYEPKRRADCQELQEHPFMKPKSEDEIRAQTALSLQQSQSVSHMRTSTVMLTMPDELLALHGNSEGGDNSTGTQDGTQDGCDSRWSHYYNDGQRDRGEAGSGSNTVTATAFVTTNRPLSSSRRSNRGTFTTDGIDNQPDYTYPSEYPSSFSYTGMFGDTGMGGGGEDDPDATYRPGAGGLAGVIMGGNRGNRSRGGSGCESDLDATIMTRPLPPRPSTTGGNNSAVGSRRNSFRHNVDNESDAKFVSSSYDQASTLNATTGTATALRRGSKDYSHWDGQGSGQGTTYSAYERDMFAASQKSSSQSQTPRSNMATPRRMI